MYRRLDPHRITETLGTLQARICERFPESGLSKVCAELTAIANEARKRARHLSRPNLFLRTASALVVVAGLAAIVYLAQLVSVQPANTEITSLMQGIDAGVSLIIVMGAAVLFLTTLEGRYKRSEALTHLHELRSVVHVIDMHQLTKDPSTILNSENATASSPTRTMSAFELTRYLNYCSELLSMTAKVAALYAQASTDAQVVEAVNDLERLTTNLSQKVWAKDHAHRARRTSCNRAAGCRCGSVVK